MRRYDDQSVKCTVFTTEFQLTGTSSSKEAILRIIALAPVLWRTANNSSQVKVEDGIGTTSHTENAMKYAKNFLNIHNAL